MVRRGARQNVADSRDFVPMGSASINGRPVEDHPGPTIVADPAMEHPMDDARPVPRRSQTVPVPLNHRLSFDHASGVIMLPDDEGDWMGEEPDSDEEDIAIENRVGLEPSGTDTLIGVEDLSASTESVAPLNPSRSSRYGTYFHHPERRRQTIPGAFPR